MLPHARQLLALVLLLAAAVAAFLLTVDIDRAEQLAAQPLGGASARARYQGGPPAPVPVPAAAGGAPPPAPDGLAAAAPGVAAVPAALSPTPGAPRCFTGVPGATELHRQPAVATGSPCRPFVAVVAPCTSRGKSYKNVAGTPYVSTFFKTVLQTLVKSKDAGYDVAFYVGYDAGDPIWDTDKARSEIAGLLQKQVDQYYKKSLLEEVREMDLMGNSHLAGLSIKTVKCQSKSMVAASNCVIKQLYDDGAEYWYRVNDDTHFVTANWIQDFNAQLASFKPPNLGAVGPTCRQGNTAILTYDYVHRTHWEVFGFQYPPILKNWWCDDWITRVYGGARTKKLPKQEVKHLISGTRYQVYSKDSSGRSVPKDLLPAEYKKSSCTIDAWLGKNPAYGDLPRTVNSEGRCATSAPSKKCAKALDGRRLGGAEGWSWALVAHKHPNTAEWSACAVPGHPDATGGGCVNGRTNPDPTSSCGELCAETEGCNFFWVFHTAGGSARPGRCCLKNTYDPSGGDRPTTKVNGGFYKMEKT